LPLSSQVARSCREAGVQFPFLCLLVSGGHNLLLVARGVGNYLQLGSTLDDALGEPSLY
jgi:N6-L-threonylcarbamoyladenine synthase